MGDRQNVLVRKLVELVCADLTNRLTVQKIEVLCDAPPDLCVHADGDRLRKAICILAMNALDAMPRGGKLWINGCVGAHGVELEIADSGPGFSDPRRRAVSSTAADGLEEARQNVVASGGAFGLANCPEGGAVYLIHFPKAPARAAA